MVKHKIQPSGLCLNCGSAHVQNYCPVCGQKAQPTKLPIRLFLADTIESLFNIDNRWFITLRHLFTKPGKVTEEYINGKRAKYLPPLRIYLSMSIMYFLLVQVTKSSQVFFINLSNGDEGIESLGTIVQYSLFLLVPVFALILMLLYRKRKAFYLEYLILALHIHTIWFVLFMVELLTVWLTNTFNTAWVGWLAKGINIPNQLAFFIYLGLYQKRTFNESWVKVIFKSFGVMLLYMMALTSVLALYYFVILDFIP